MLVLTLICDLLIISIEIYVLQGLSMSTVKYFNKKANRILVYDYTSYTDPATKKSKAIRKYLGFEDPVTHIFTPTSGKPGRPVKLRIPDPSEQDQDRQKIYAALYAEIDTLKKALVSEHDKTETLSKEREDLLKKVSGYKHIVDSMRNVLSQESEIE